MTKTTDERVSVTSRSADPEVRTAADFAADHWCEIERLALVAHIATLRPRHLPLAVTLRNPELDAVAALRPDGLEDAFRKAAAEELLRAREEALTHIRRAGVLVLDVAPQRAAQAVVASYLDLKRRGRL